MACANIGLGKKELKMVVDIAIDPDLLDWDKIKKDATQLMLKRGRIKSIKEAEKLDWPTLLANSRAELEKKYIEYTRHRELMTALTACISYTPIWK
jgi:hypothetical protein